MQEVVVCNFTEGDMGFTGRCFKSLEEAHRIADKELKPYMEDYEASNIQELINFGYINFKTVKVEGE